MTTTDPLWTDEDRGLLLALRDEERHECGGCGQPLEISTDRATSGQWDIHRSTCQACVVLEAEVSNDHEGNRTPRGVKYSILHARPEPE